MATLLVIEDEQVLAKNIARYFEKQGHTVEVALDGMQGLQIATQIRPDVVIVDFQLPGMDGLEIIRALKHGDVVCLFPEGQLTRTGTLCVLQRGFELIARQWTQ